MIKPVSPTTHSNGTSYGPAENINLPFRKEVLAKAHVRLDKILSLQKPLSDEMNLIEAGLVLILSGLAGCNPAPAPAPIEKCKTKGEFNNALTQSLQDINGILESIINRLPEIDDSLSELAQLISSYVGILEINQKGDPNCKLDSGHLRLFALPLLQGLSNLMLRLDDSLKHDNLSIENQNRLYEFIGWSSKNAVPRLEKLLFFGSP